METSVYYWHLGIQCLAFWLKVLDLGFDLVGNAAGSLPPVPARNKLGNQDKAQLRCQSLMLVRSAQGNPHKLSTKKT